jgi:hypothetical protein
VTRDSIPRDDLYGELEVSRQASVAAIEAAYRRLVKQHHPDVARSDDLERIKRLNLAREWLTDLDRRRRYDVSRGISPTSSVAHHSPNGNDAPPGTRRRPGPSPGGSVPDASSEPARSFGVNASEVRIFLAGLRGLDSERARRVFDGRAVAHAKGYTGARRLAAQIGQANRKIEWQLAREAASVIARGKLGDTILTEQVVDVLADTAGAIAIRDLLSSSDYRTLLLPWTWTSARVEGVKAAVPGATATSRATASPDEVPTRSALGGATVAAAATAPTAASIGAPPSIGIRGVASKVVAAGVPPEPAVLTSTRASRPGAYQGGARPRLSATVVPLPSVSIPAWTPPTAWIRRWLPGLLAFAVSSIATAALLGTFRPPLEQGVAGLTDAPAPTSAPTQLVVVPGQSVDGTAEPTASDSSIETPRPGGTKRPGGGGPGPDATEPPDPTKPGSTPKPTPKPTPTPAPTPTLTPAPVPTPTPGPTPTQSSCSVIDLVGVMTSSAPELWAAAGFLGSLTFDPAIPPQFKIAWQSRVAGSSVPCSSGMTVREVAP